MAMRGDDVIGIQQNPQAGVLSQTWGRGRREVAGLLSVYAARMSNCSAREGRGVDFGINVGLETFLAIFRFQMGPESSLSPN